MERLSAEEKQRYDQLSEKAKAGLMRPGPEMSEWQAFGQRYAVQLEAERREHIARRKEQMEAFLADKRAYGEAKVAYEQERASAKAALKHGEELNFPPFTAPEPERDFSAWLAKKGLS